MDIRQPGRFLRSRVGAAMAAPTNSRRSGLRPRRPECLAPRRRVGGVAPTYDEGFAEASGPAPRPAATDSRMEARRPYSIARRTPALSAWYTPRLCRVPGLGATSAVRRAR